MSEIEFNDEQGFVRSEFSKESTGLVGLVQKWGFVKNTTQAQYLLLGIVIISVLIMVCIYFSSGEKETPQNQLPPDAFAPNPMGAPR